MAEERKNPVREYMDSRENPPVEAEETAEDTTEVED